VAEISEWSPAVSDAVARVRAECVAEDGHDPLDEAAQLRLKHHGLTESRLWLVDEVGFALLHRGSLDLAVAPSYRARGMGTTLAGLAAGDTASAWSHGDHPAAAKLASRHGFVPSRELWVMRRSTSIPLPHAVGADGVVLRGFEPGDESEILRVNASAFAHHPEQAGMDAANLAERMAEPWFDPQGLLVAVDPAERMLGFHWTKRHSRQTAEVYVVAVAPEAQGRGLGKHLTLAGLDHLSDVDEIILYVESDNLPGRALYEGLGFTHAAVDTHVQYLRA